MDASSRPSLVSYALCLIYGVLVVDTATFVAEIFYNPTIAEDAAEVAMSVGGYQILFAIVAGLMILTTLFVTQKLKMARPWAYYLTIAFNLFFVAMIPVLYFDAGYPRNSFDILTDVVSTVGSLAIVGLLLAPASRSWIAAAKR